MILYNSRELAPEVGLEPTTHRLTADCSTIELLWNPNEASIYKSPFGPSTDDFTGSSRLATRTVERAAGGLCDSPNPRPANETWTARPTIYLESLQVQIRRPSSLAVIKKPVFAARARPLQRNGAAEFNRFRQHGADASPQTRDLPARELSRRESRRNAGAKKRFAGINIPQPGDEGLIQQLHFDRLD